MSLQAASTEHAYSEWSDAYHPALDLRLCNHIATIETYYASGAARNVQTNEKQHLGLFLVQSAVDAVFSFTGPRWQLFLEGDRN